MGQEIVYCRKCQTRLVSSDFEKGTAFRIEGIASCDKCSAEVLRMLPPDKIQGFLHQIGKAKKNAAPPEKAAPRPENRRGTGSIPIVPAVPKTSRTPSKSKGWGPAVWIGLAVGAAGLVVLILMFAGRSDTVEPIPERSAPPKTPPPVAPSRESKATVAAGLKAKALEAQRKGAAEEVKALREQVARLGAPELLADFDSAVKPAVEPAKGPRARIVRIENPFPILSLAEVQVFSGAENVALKGRASQISTGLDAYANRAIDGNTDGNWGANSTTHTEGAAVPSWWEVDLGAMVSIDRVIVWNRTDAGLGNRLMGYSVLLLDEARTLVASRIDEGSPNPSTEHVFGGTRR